MRHAVWLLIVLAWTGSAQNALQQAQAMPGQLSQHSVRPTVDFGDTDSVDEEKRLRILNADRQKSLVADTNKLLKLANELNAEIAGANVESLTPAQLRKIAEIEKLAHNVKEKMSTSVRGTPVFQQQSPPILR